LKRLQPIPFYTAINRSLVQQALAPLATRPPDSTLMIVDMAVELD